MKSYILFSFSMCSILISDKIHSFYIISSEQYCNRPGDDRKLVAWCAANVEDRRRALAVSVCEDRRRALAVSVCEGY